MEASQPESQPDTQELQVQAPAAENVNWGRMFLDILETVVLAVVLFLGINAISARVRVDGSSMNPTLQNGEFVLVSRMAYRIGDMQRGDIIVFRSINEIDLDLIKRVIGLPGDDVMVQDGRVMINGQPLSEPYIAAPPRYNGEWQVPEGYLFVLGDNRNDSSDSHQWGLLPLDNVIGKAVLIYWPPPEWNLIQHFDLITAF